MKNVHGGVYNQKDMDLLVRICKRESRFFGSRRRSSQQLVNTLLAKVIRASVAVQDSQLLLEVIKGCASWVLVSEVDDAVADALLIFPFHQIEPRRVTRILYLGSRADNL